MEDDLMAEDVSSFRRTRVLLALGPLAGTAGAFVGVTIVLDSPSSLVYLSFDKLYDLGLAFYLTSSLLTVGTAALGSSREKPFHALKACAALAVAQVLPGLVLARTIGR
jgi:hypothetical protein